jgi:hypothetical protein
MSVTYVILVAETEGGEIKTALVCEYAFKSDPDPRNYFRSGMKSVEKSGEVEIGGDVHLLPETLVEG